MNRVTTPTHTFKIGISSDNISKILITYSQGSVQKLNKTEEDVTFEGEYVKIRLTQNETKLFKAGTVQIQIRVKLIDGTVINSQIINRKVNAVLNDEVL